MAGTSSFLQSKAAGLEFNGVAFAYPATVYAALLLCSNGPLARSTAYTVGNTVSYVTANANHLYKCTTAGTTTATAPAYPGASNEVITDGTAVFTEQTSALEAGTAMVEPTSGGYARVGIACTSAGFTIAVPNVTNAALISYPTPTATWDTAPAEVWGFATYDALTAGNLMRFGGLTADQIINTGNTVSFAVSAMKFVLDQ